MSVLHQYPECNGFLAIIMFSKISLMNSSEQIAQKATIMGNFWPFFMSSKIHKKTDHKMSIEIWEIHT